MDFICLQSKLRVVLILYGASPDMTGDLKIAKPDWESYCQQIADLVVAEQSPARLLEVRAKLYELLSHCIPPTVILKVCPACNRLVHTLLSTRRSPSESQTKWMRPLRQTSCIGQHSTYVCPPSVVGAP